MIYKKKQKNYLLFSTILLLLFVANVTYGQTKDDIVYSNTEKMPSFPTGSGNLLIFINQNMKYPDSALNNNIQGTTVVSFIVDKRGVIQNPIVTKSVAPSLDSEAIRIISLMPKWIPGMHDGQNVNVKYSQPIDFNITVYKLGHPSRQSGHSEIPPSPGFDVDKYVQDNLEYPESARLNNIEGIVVVKFVINEDGSLSNFIFLRSVYPSIDAEALRVMKNMPNWKPGIQDGKPVKVYMTQKIRFSLH